MQLNLPKVFIAGYTAYPKKYCDTKFFNRVKNIAYPKELLDIQVVDNTIETIDYMSDLKQIVPDANKLYHVTVPHEPRESYFQRKVAESVQHLRAEFLKTDAEYFVIFESDVLVPIMVINQLLHAKDELEAQGKKWAAIGGIYYPGFHDYSIAGIDVLKKTHHVLSGCTLYKREIIEKFPFRWSTQNLGAFSDAWICSDINDAKEGWELYDYGNILCDHMEDAYVGRGQGLLHKETK